VVDLPPKFDLPEIEYTQRTCIIVVQVQADSHTIPDGHRSGRRGRSDESGARRYQRHARLQPGCGNHLWLGMAKTKGKVNILLDVDQVLTNQQLQGLDALVQ